jgi:PAS domain S-box-containing protein
MPFFICPNCKERSIDTDSREGFSDHAPACRRCGFGFLFELLEDYYPAPTSGLVVADQKGRVLAVGRGVFELTGYRESDLLGHDLVEAFRLSGFDGQDPVATTLEWGVRRLGQQLEIKTRAGTRKRVTADFFPAYDTDGGLLVALTPRK